MRTKWWAVALASAWAALQWSCQAPNPAAAAPGSSPSSPAVIREPLRLQRVGTLTDPLLSESSGLAAMPSTSPWAFWTLNDSGNAPILFALDPHGVTLLHLPVAADNRDWEDLAADARGRLYIADVGNNQRRRVSLFIHRLTPPPAARLQSPIPHHPSALTRPIDPDCTWTLHYPDAPFDCETLFIHQGFAYLVSKHWYDQPAGLYRFPLDEEQTTQTLEQVADLPIRDPITGGALSGDGRYLALVSYTGLWIFPIDNDPAAAATVPPITLRWAVPNLEAVAFSSDGQALFLTTESRVLYRCDLAGD